MKLRDLPQFDRPREKLVRYGPDRLSDSELLALILGTGSQGMNVVELARKVLLKFGRQKMSQLSYKDLVDVFGLGPTKAAAILAAFELSRRVAKNQIETVIFKPQDVWLTLQSIRSHKKEHFIVFYLNSRSQVIDREVISVGTVNASMVHPREVYEPAIKYVASQIVVAHNHPSGSLEPSADDIQVTQRLTEAGHLLGIELIDHVIIAKEGYLSFKEKGLLVEGAVLY